MALTKASDVSAADWQSQTNVKNPGDTVFLNGGNLYKALPFIQYLLINPLFSIAFCLFREPSGRCKSMESLVIQEQSKDNAIFHTEDSGSESNTSEMSRHRDEDSTYFSKQYTRSQTPEPKKEKFISEFTSSPGTSPRVQKPVAHSPSMLQLQVQDPLFRTLSGDQDKSSPSRVSYEGSSSMEYQVRYVGGYRSGPEDDFEEPVRLMPYYRSPTRHRKVDEPLEGTEGRRRINQLDSTLHEHSVTCSQSSYQSRDERADLSQSYNRSPSSSPYHHRKAIDSQNCINNAQSVGISPVSVQKQKKTAIVSPLLDASESRPRSVPPGVLTFDPTDPESERVEEVSILYLPAISVSHPFSG